MTLVYVPAANPDATCLTRIGGRVDATLFPDWMANVDYGEFAAQAIDSANGSGIVTGGGVSQHMIANMGPNASAQVSASGSASASATPTFEVIEDIESWCGLWMVPVATPSTASVSGAGYLPSSPCVVKCAVTFGVNATSQQFAGAIGSFQYSGPGFAFANGRVRCWATATSYNGGAAQIQWDIAPLDRNGNTLPWTWPEGMNEIPYAEGFATASAQVPIAPSIASDGKAEAYNSNYLGGTSSGFATGTGTYQVSVAP